MKNEEFIITETKEAESLSLNVVGRINTINAGALEHKLENALKEKQELIILEMDQVEYLSSTGIRVILKIYRQAKQAGKKFCIDSPSENVKNVLGLTALDELLIK